MNPLFEKTMGLLGWVVKVCFLFGHLQLVWFRVWLGCVFFEEFSVF